MRYLRAEKVGDVPDFECRRCRRRFRWMQEEAWTPSSVCIGLRLYLPEAWAGDLARKVKRKIPETVPFQKEALRAGQR
jgi:hypothetical protein